MQGDISLVKNCVEEWIDCFSEGMVVIDRDGKVVLLNRKIHLQFSIIDIGENMYDWLIKYGVCTNWEKLKKYLSVDGKNIVGKLYYNECWYTVSFIYCLKQKYRLIVFEDSTKINNLENKVKNIADLNQQIQTFFLSHSENLYYVTDKNGNTIYFSNECLANCGVSKEYLMGKNVRDLEKKKIFYPSVITRVLESHRMEIVMQRTGKEKKFISIGIPLIDDQGDIYQIVALTQDISRKLMLANSLSVQLSEKCSSIQSYHSLITCSSVMHDVIESIKLVSAVDSTVLLEGETGTGKEIIAHLIHDNSSRKNNAFIKVNCGSISSTLIESELYGYESGAFTGAKREGKIGLIEAANGGTLFLDEINELPLDQQVKLLQVLQERFLIRVGGTKPIALNIRFIAALNQNIENLVKEKKFRKDLYYRLNVVPIQIPPLRERKEDIPLLIKHFLEKVNKKYHLNKEFSISTISMLQKYSWPGNVRELENMVERMAVIGQRDLVTNDIIPEHVIKEIMNTSNIISEKCLDGTGLNVFSVKENSTIKERGDETLPDSLTKAIEMYEENLIRKAIGKYGTAIKASKALHVNQSTFSRKVKKYGIKVISSTKI